MAVQENLSLGAMFWNKNKPSMLWNTFHQKNSKQHIINPILWHINAGSYWWCIVGWSLWYEACLTPLISCTVITKLPLYSCKTMSQYVLGTPPNSRTSLRWNLFWQVLAGFIYVNIINEKFVYSTNFASNWYYTEFSAWLGDQHFLDILTHEDNMLCNNCSKSQCFPCLLSNASNQIYQVQKAWGQSSIQRKCNAQKATGVAAIVFSKT